MTRARSKVVSGTGAGQSGLWKRATNLASRVGEAHMAQHGADLLLDSSLTFWAQLGNTTAEALGAAATFTRASDGLYRPYNGAGWQVASKDGARFENGQLLMEPASTNVFLNSDAPATQTITLGTTGSWTISCYGTGSVTSSNGTGVATGHGTATEGSPVTINVTTAGTFTFTVAGALDLAQVENQPVATSPIITAGASASRGADKLNYSDASVFFSQTQGMALITFVPGFDKAELSTIEGLLSLNSPDKANLLYFDTAFKSTDGTNTASVATPAYVSGDVLRVAALYGPTGASALQVGYSLNGAAWVWSAAVAYDGAFTTDNILTVMNSIGIPMHASEIRLYNENRGTTWVEGNYP